MPDYKLVIFLSLSASTRSGRWTNVFHFRSNNALGSDALSAEIDPLVNGIRAASLDVVTIDRVVVKDVTQEGHGYDPLKVRTIPKGLVGQKLVAADHPEIKEVTEMVRLKATTGRPGRNGYRMAILDSEVTGGTDGDPSATGAPAGAEALATAISNAITGGLQLLIWSRRKDGTITSRLALSAEYAGVHYRTARRRKKHKPTGKNPATWKDDAITALKIAGGVLGGYQVAKAVIPALAEAAIATAAEAAGTATGGLLALLAAL